MRLQNRLSRKLDVGPALAHSAFELTMRSRISQDFGGQAGTETSAPGVKLESVGPRSWPCDRFTIVATASAVAMAFSGCARFEPKPLYPVGNVEIFQARTLADPGLRVFLVTNGFGDEWPRQTWDLRTLTLAAFYYHPDLDVARAKWAVATAGRQTATERPNPTLNVAPAYNTTTSIPSPWLVTATLDISIETAGKRGYRIAEASHLSEAARLNIAGVAWQVRSLLRRALLDVYTSRETEALLTQQQVVQTENVRLLEQQYDAGVISAFELTQARITADSSRLVLRDAERQRAEAQALLADAIGVPVAALATAEVSFTGLTDLPDDVPPEAARRQALLNRPDILGALAEYNASQAALQLEIAKQYPDLHFNPGYEFDQGDNKWSPGFTVTLPVLNQNKGPIAEAEAKRAEAAATFNALQSRVIGEIERAVASYRVTLQKSKEAEAIQENLKQQEKRAQAMLEAGEISKSELAALRLQLSASALGRMDAFAKSLLVFQQLEDALQSPLGLPAQLWQQPPRRAEATP
jgi:outer membrane protein, heavy metal efflux system